MAGKWVKKGEHEAALAGAVVGLGASECGPAHFQGGPQTRCEILGLQRPGLENRPAPAASSVRKAQLRGPGGGQLRKGD